MRQCRCRQGSSAIARRLSAFAIVALCIAGQLATLAHRVLVQHAVCAEHGESVHLRGSATSGNEPASLGGRAGLGPGSPFASLGSAARVTVEDHEHCSLAASRTAPAQHLTDGTLVPPVDDPGRLTPPALPPGPLSPPYLVAPKTSPPA